MKVLVTGARGFVGREIADELRRLDFEVVSVGRTARSAKETEFRDEDYFAADISDYETFGELEKIGRVDAVIHSAGLAHQFGDTTRERFEAVNVRGTENVLRLAAKLQARQFVLIGSTAVYGIKSIGKSASRSSSETATTEDAECRPETVYAESKLAAEKAALDFCAENNTALTILRLAPVVGENGAGNAARLIEAIDGGRFLFVGAGENLKSFVYKTDVARACVKVLSGKRNEAEIFNIAAAAPVKMSDFVRAIAESLGVRVPKIKIPAVVPRIFFRINRQTLRLKKIERLGETIEKWLSDDVYSAAKIRAAYEFTAETSIETAIKKQVAAYKTNAYKTNKEKK